MSAEMPDLDAIVREWAYEMYECTKTRDQPKVGKECLDLNIIWDHVRFIHHPPEYTEEKPAAPKARVLFKTFFSNYTKGVQEFSFKTERKTERTSEIKIDEGITTGTTTVVGFKTPYAVFAANAGFSRNVLMDISCNECLQDEIIWEVNSLITVQPMTRISAELTLNENTYTGRFKLQSQMFGKVIVKVMDYEEGTPTRASIEGDLADIIKKGIENGAKGFTVMKNNVISYQTKGVCTFTFSSNQAVVVNQNPLPK